MTKIDRPFNQYREIFRSSNRESRELLKYVFEKADNISLWIIGLSIGAISIFANNIAGVQKVISPGLLRPILLLLTVSVTSGIIYRILYLYFFAVLNNILRGIDIAFSKQKTMDTVSYLDGTETFKQLIDKVKDGFGDDLSYLIPVYEKIDEGAGTDLYKSVVEHYLKNVDFAQMDCANAMDFIAETYSGFYGISKEKYLKKLKNHNMGKQYKWTLRIATIFYLVYLLSFIIALFTFALAT